MKQHNNDRISNNVWNIDHDPTYCIFLNSNFYILTQEKIIYFFIVHTP